MAKPNQETPIYKAWRHEREEKETDARELGAIDVRAAAMLWARYAHSDGGWEWTWPITVRVRDPQGKLWDVEVERELVPEFVPGKPVAVK
jgi:hypothetical protein